MHRWRQMPDHAHSLQLKRVTFGTNDLIKRSSHCVLLTAWLSPIQLALNASPIGHILRDFQT